MKFAQLEVEQAPTHRRASTTRAGRPEGLLPMTKLIILMHLDKPSQLRRGRVVRRNMYNESCHMVYMYKRETCIHVVFMSLEKK